MKNPRTLKNGPQKAAIKRVLLNSELRKMGLANETIIDMSLSELRDSYHLIRESDFLSERNKSKNYFEKRPEYWFSFLKSSVIQHTFLLKHGESKVTEVLRRSR